MDIHLEHVQNVLLDMHRVEEQILVQNVLQDIIVELEQEVVQFVLMENIQLLLELLLVPLVQRHVMDIV